jgi:hypothetical protein
MQERRPHRAGILGPQGAGMAVADFGSLTRPGATSGTSCRSCGSTRLTELAMTLTDGTPVTFVSCHHCETRSWSHGGRRLSFTTILHKTRKPR